MTKANLILIATILAGLGGAAVMLWAWYAKVELPDSLAGFLGACMASFLVLLKSPLGEGK